MSDQSSSGNKGSKNSLIALLVAVAVGLLYFVNTGSLAILLPEQYNVILTPTPSAGETAAVFAQGSTGGVQEATVAPTVAPAMPTNPASINGLPIIVWDDLPPQAWDTIALIDQGGPFPYDRDGIPFQNRERLLPQERKGFYSEYTVKTPGSSDRGARRIIAGDDGILYYTDDHYDSFRVVVR